jgi:hypothetical protein
MERNKRLFLRMVLSWTLVTVPDVDMGCCLGSEGNGVCLGKRCEGWPGPLGGKKDKQSVHN